MPFAITFTVKVREIVEKTRALPARKVGEKTDEHGQKQPVWDLPREKLGWFVAFEGSYEAVHVGKEKPDLVIGQELEVTIKTKEQSRPIRVLPPLVPSRY